MMRTKRQLSRQIFSFCAQFLLLATATISAIAQTLDHFDFSTITSPHQAYVPFRIIITAKSSSGATVRTFTGAVQLTANSTGGVLPVEAFSALKFTSGQWSGIVSINAAGPDVTLQALDPLSGRTGTSKVFQVDPADFQEIDLPVISIASDSARGVLYASVGPISGVGTVHVIDPANGSVIDSHQIVGGAGRIEISSDASKLYVVSDDESTVRRLALPDFAEEITLNLGEWEPGSLNRAEDLAVHPTKANTIAVTKQRRGFSPRFTGLSVFEDTVEKQMPSSAIAEANAVAWGSNENRLYGWDSELSSSRLSQYDVTATDVAYVTSRWAFLVPFNGQIHFVGGKLYCTTGRIIDPETYTLFGELANGNSDALMLPLPDRRRIIYFTPSTIGFMLTYDSDTLQLVGNDPFPMPRGAGSGVAFWGQNGIAFHDGVRLFLAQNRLIPSGQPADIEVTANMTQGAAVAIGVDQEMQATVHNLGPQDAGHVLIRVDGPLDAVLTGGSVIGANAVTSIQARRVTYELSSLASGASVTVKFTAHSNVEAWEPFSIVAVGTGIDPNSSNNSAGVVLKAAGLPAVNSATILRLASAASASDRTRGQIYLAPSSGSAPWGNSIVTVNPVSGEISQPVLVGSRPSRLAVSDDGKYLYVGFQGVPEARRFLLPTLQYDLTIPLGADGFLGPRFAGPIDVRPGHANEIVAARFNGASANASADRFGYFRDATEITPDRSSPELVHFAGPDRVLVHEDSSGIFRFDITDAGLNFVTILRDVDSFLPPDFAFNDGKLYFGDGQAFDADTGAALGSFFVFGPYASAPVVDQAGGRALFPQRTTTNYMIAAFDLTNYSQVGSNYINGTSLGIANSFSRWSGDGLALSGSGGLALIKTDLVNAGASELRVATITVTGSTVTISFSNLTPGQYAVEQSADLSGTWTRLGDPFTDTTTEIPITSSDSREFYRLVKLQ